MNDTIRSLPNGDFRVGTQGEALPPIDQSMIPKTRSDRNLPVGGYLNTGDTMPRYTDGVPEDHAPVWTGFMGVDAYVRRTTSEMLRKSLSVDDFAGDVAAFGAAERAERKHSHYYKDVSKLQMVDVYRVLALFAVSDPCLQHAIKKLLVAGGRGAGKDIARDVKEAVDSLHRWQEMRAEEAAS